MKRIILILLITTVLNACGDNKTADAVTTDSTSGVSSNPAPDTSAINSGTTGTTGTGTISDSGNAAKLPAGQGESVIDTLSNKK